MGDNRAPRLLREIDLLGLRKCQYDGRGDFSAVTFPSLIEET